MASKRATSLTPITSAADGDVIPIEDITDTSETKGITKANLLNNQPQSNITNLSTDLNSKAPIASPTFTGTVAIPNVADVEAAVVANTAKNSYPAVDSTKLAGIEAGATADQSDSEIETAYNNQVAQVTPAEKTAGTEIALRTFAPADIASMAATHGGGGANKNQSYTTQTNDTVAAGATRYGPIAGSANYASVPANVDVAVGRAITVESLVAYPRQNTSTTGSASVISLEIDGTEDASTRISIPVGSTAVATLSGLSVSVPKDSKVSWLIINNFADGTFRPNSREIVYSVD